MINKDNYIEFIVDYYDGKLPKELQDELLAFLEGDPVMYEEFQLFGDNSTAGFGDMSIKAPASLVNQLQSIPDSVFSMNEQWLAAYAEGDLVGEEAEKVRNLVTHDPYWYAEYRLMVSTRVSPDRTIVFPNKERLLRREGTPLIRRMMYTVSAAAATLLVAYLLWPTNDTFNGSLLNSPTAHVNANLERSSSHSDSNNNSSVEDTYYNTNTAQSNSNNNTELTPRQYESLARVDSRSGKSLQEIPAPEPGYIDQFRTEYISIYEMVALKQSMNQEPVEKKTGTLSEWKDWGLAMVTGKSSIKDNPASEVTFRDVAGYGFNEINRYASNNLSMDRKNK